MTKIKKLKLLTSKLSILYVEDDIGIQDTMAKYLKKLFYLVVTASNGLEGVEKFIKGQFDLIITDLSMPKMNGLDMITKIREINKNQAILITTAHGESNYMLEAIQLHVDGYVLKPFNYELLNFELYKISEKIIFFKENETYKKNLQELVFKQTKEIKENYKDTLYSIVELIERRDTYTAGHSQRVAKYSQIIAKEMGYSAEECTLLYQAGMLHDIGKIETPDTVLLNPKKLNDLEYKLIKDHVEVGYNFLKNIPMFKNFAEIVYSHHERYDGKGYPRALKANDIHKLAKVMTVADSFDAMTTNRIYKGRKTVPQALQELMNLSKVQFDPEVVKAAVVALKDLQIDQKINQLPTTKLEEERFAYFYRDNLSQAYNQDYLDLVLLRNLTEKKLKYMILFSVKNFSQYNKKYTWQQGNKLLKEFANTLLSYLDEALVFRVFGDDFVTMSTTKVNIGETIKNLDEILVDTNVGYSIQLIDLNDIQITTLHDLEKIQHKESTTKSFQ